MAGVSGELIRSLNYVEDITTTLRRIGVTVPSLTPEEKQRLAEALRSAAAGVNAMVGDLEKAK